MSLSFSVWIIAPIRQIGQKYFIFFLILISGDIITIICRYAFHSRTNVFYIIANLLCLISIQQRKNSNLFKILIFVLAIATFVVEYFNFGYKDEFLLIGFSNFLLFYKFSQQSIIKYTEEKILNIFLGCLAFNELIGVTKFVGFITEASSATIYFEVATTIQVLIGVFFCIYRESDPRLLIKVK
jgi:hypothetical protein